MHRTSAPLRRRARSFALVAVLASGVPLMGLAATSCADCTERTSASVASPGGAHVVSLVHRSCGGAAGAEEDRVFIRTDSGDPAIALRVHHQIGEPTVRWIDDTHVAIGLRARADVVENRSPVDGVFVQRG